MRSFLVRALVAVVAIPALVYLFYLGGEPLRLLIVLLIVLACIEARLLSARAGAVYLLVPMLLAALAIPFVSARYLPGISWPGWLTLLLIVSALPAVMAREVNRAALAAAGHLVCVVWIALGFSAILALRESIDGQGFHWLVFLFATLWVGDTAAYLFGVWLGKAKLAPIISPKKTVVGAVAQMIASAALGGVFVATNWIDAPAALLISGSVLIGTVGQLGDLFESVLKRAAGAKDSSALIPGHGGVLDRFDSTMFAAPSLYMLLQVWPR